MTASTNLRGAAAMIGAAVTFTAMTALVKLLGQDYSPAFQTFVRQTAGLLVLAPVIAARGPAVFRTRRPTLMILRALGSVAALTLSFHAYQTLPLGEANALSFTRILWMTPLAILLLGEKASSRRLGAVAVGFVGVLMMAGPLGATLDATGVVAGLGAAGLFALTVTGMKLMTREDAAVTLLVWGAALGCLLALPGALLTWRWPSPLDASLLTLMGVLGIATQALYIRGMQLGDALVMAPIDYTRLVFASAIGFAVFGERLGPNALAGATVIIVATLYITWRETPRRPPPPTT